MLAMDRAMDDASEAVLHDDEETLPDRVPKHVVETQQAEQQKPQPHGRHRAE